MGTEPQLAFYQRLPEPPGLEVRVNFGVFAGRAATAAEIDDLAQGLLSKVGEVSIVAEDRHEIGEESEASLHQVRIGRGSTSAEVSEAVLAHASSALSPSRGR